ncbi:MAG: hypoxanthine phosphoribosyltransferase [Vicinamibacterales bacterium]
MAESSQPSVLIDAAAIHARVVELASEIAPDFPEGVHLVAVLKGAFVFLADLMRHLSIPVSIDFLAVSSYASGTTTSGEVRVLKDLEIALDGRDVLLVEDIIDTGLTLSYLHDILQARSPRSLRTAALLSKPSRRRLNVPLDYVGFTIPDRFVVGYGMDHGERYRNLTYVGFLEQSVEEAFGAEHRRV